MGLRLLLEAKCRVDFYQNGVSGDAVVGVGPRSTSGAASNTHDTVPAAPNLRPPLPHTAHCIHLCSLSAGGFHGSIAQSTTRAVRCHNNVVFVEFLSYC